MLKKKIIYLLFIFIFVSHTLIFAKTPKTTELLRWTELAELPPASGEKIQPGLAGPFAGISNGVLIIAGGANFFPPVWENPKIYHDDIYVFSPTIPESSHPQRTQTSDKSAHGEWVLGAGLDRPIAYGASVSLNGDVVCMGGMDDERVFDDVFLLRWNADSQKITKQYLPDLPTPCANGYAAVLGKTVYLAGGQSGTGLESAMKNFWALDFSKKPVYKNMNNEELIALAKRRGLQITGKEPNRQSSIIQALLKSDSIASSFSSLDRAALIRELNQRSEKFDPALNREQLLAKLMHNHWGDFRWKKLPSWPGPKRALNITVVQHNGENNCVYVLSGRRQDQAGKVHFLRDVYEFNPAKFNSQKKSKSVSPWRKRADVPRCVMAGTGIGVGQSHIFILGGADGSFFYKADELKDHHPGFPKTALAYHTITNTWINAGKMPTNQVTTTAIRWNDSIIVPCGEIRPRTRTAKIWKAEPVKTQIRFGWINFVTLGLYLTAMVLIGVYFANKNKNTDDYFRGGQRIPWWAAGCSIFATMLSSITYMSIPAKAYAANWEYIMGGPAILVTAAFVVYFVLPFFRQIDATSAYEYLEKRFNRMTRWLGSSFFILFQIGRMAIVMFLSALALAAITPFTEVECILIMGLLSIIYCTLGGVEAVIWTDTIQTFVLIGGAILIFAMVLIHIDGGFAQFLILGAANGKFHIVNWDWDAMSYTTTAFWVLVLGGLGQNIVSYTSDQAVVQRYMTTSDQKKAARAIWTNGLMSIPALILFFSLGTALFVFYKMHPSHLDPTFKTDAVMPLFIVRELPAGVAGLIVAGIFAAAQSTISTSMNSTATTIVTDFFRPLHLAKSEKTYLNLARIMTFLLGLAGTVAALLFASADVKSLFEQFIAVLGLFGGSLGGLFLLGMFTRKANGPGAITGAVVAAVVLYLVKVYTATHLYLYAFIGVTTCFIVGYFASALFPAGEKALEGLTIYTKKR